MPCEACEKTVVGKTLAEVLTMPASAELDRIGEFVVFGNDLRPKTVGDYVEAVHSILWQFTYGGPGPIVYHFSVPGEVGYRDVPIVFDTERPCTPSETGDWRYWAWLHRKGQDYAEALEQRVAEFRMSPRPFSSCGKAMVELIDGLSERDIDLTIWADAFDGFARFKVEPSPMPKPLNDNLFFARKMPHAVLLAAISARWDEVAS